MVLNRLQVESISPYTPNFLEYIDPRLRPSIKLLTEKRYLTSYCCEGHSLSKYRHIDIAFGSDKQREDFKKILRIFLSRFWLRTEDLESLSSELVGDDVKVWQDRESEIIGFNRLFLRKYEYYCFLRVYIGKRTPQYLSTSKKNFIDEVRSDLLEFYVVSYNFIFRYLATKIFERDLKKRCPVFLG